MRSIAGRYNSGTRFTSLLLIFGELKTFRATSAVVVDPPKPFASGNAKATPMQNYHHYRYHETANYQIIVTAQPHLNHNPTPTQQKVG